MKKQSKSPQTLQEKIGVKGVGVTLNPKSCRERALRIRTAVKRNPGLKAEVRLSLLKQASWYAWKAKQFSTKKNGRARKAA